ncbi:MAG: c-type cytochrome [Deltaproteobacteria bacterium]|nr:c-type cytochrome [Deltaproteobacteria bacterium]
MAQRHDHKKAYTRVWIGLLILTIITVDVAYHDWGYWNIFIAMLIATIKASLVVLFFMHLKYDNKVNQVVFVSAFFFLAVFVGLTGSDIFKRPYEQAIAVERAPGEGSVSAEEVEKLRVATPEAVEAGKKLYAAQCATCHGAEGKGDGAAAAALTPGPRNFTSDEGWKFGRAPSEMLKTVTDGSPGTSMASFSGVPVKDRWAVVHYVRTFMRNPPEDTPETIAKVTTPAAGAAPEQPKAFIPVTMAMQLMAEPEQRQFGVRKNAPANGLGQALYQQHCVSCHGAAGEGAIKVRTIGSNPYTYLKTKSFSESKGAWVANEPAFIKLISEGMPGYGKPGLAHFTTAEWHALYAYVKALAQ